MPQAIAVVAATVANFAAAEGASAAIATAVYYAAEVAIYVGISLVSNALLAPHLPEPGPGSTPIRQPMAPRQSAFGTVRVGGVYAMPAEAQ